MGFLKQGTHTQAIVKKQNRPCLRKGGELVLPNIVLRAEEHAGLLA
jgi:hypothetical protein